MLEAWNLIPLEKIGQVSSGGTPSTKITDNWNGNIPWITPSELTALNGKYIDGNTERKITEKGLKSSSAVMVPAGSLILSTRATIGDCGVNIVPISTNQGFKNIIPNEKIIVDFLYYFIKSNKKELLRLSCGSTFLELSRNDLAKIKIPLPPLQEQKQIVSIIEKWDKYIELLDKKIEIKKNTKKYLQQVLLTGKVRLKGYEGEWEEVKFRNIGQCLRGVSYKPLRDLLPSKSQKSYFLLRSNNIQDGKLNLGDIQIVKENRVSEKQVLQLGDIVICMANGSKRLVGKSVKFNLDSDSYTVGAFMGIFRIKDPSYRSYINELFGTNKYRYYISNLLSGSSINNLKPSDIESISFIVPSSSEERYAISSILTKSDKEIKTLEKQKQLIEQQRKYLINNLVTGKIRINGN